MGPTQAKRAGGAGRPHRRPWPPAWPGTPAEWDVPVGNLGSEGPGKGCGLPGHPGDLEENPQAQAVGARDEDCTEVRGQECPRTVTGTLDLGVPWVNAACTELQGDQAPESQGPLRCGRGRSAGSPRRDPVPVIRVLGGGWSPRVCWGFTHITRAVGRGGPCTSPLCASSSQLPPPALAVSPNLKHPLAPTLPGATPEDAVQEPHPPAGVQRGTGRQAAEGAPSPALFGFPLMLWNLSCRPVLGMPASWEGMKRAG